MRGASLTQCAAFLAPAGLQLDGDMRLRDGGAWAQFPERYYLIDRPDLELPEFSRQLLDWLPMGRERLLVVSRWSADPPDQLHVFNAIRAGAGGHPGVAGGAWACLLGQQGTRGRLRRAAGAGCG